MHLGRHRFPNCLIKKKVSELLDLECINPTGLIYLFEDALRMRKNYGCVVHVVAFVSYQKLVLLMILLTVRFITL